MYDSSAAGIRIWEPVTLSISLADCCQTLVAQKLVHGIVLVTVGARTNNRASKGGDMTTRRFPLVGIAVALSALAITLLLTTCLKQDYGPPPPPGVSEDALPAGIKNFQKLDDTLYRGSQPDARGFKELEKLGIRTVINLRKRHSDRKMLAGTSLACKDIGMNVWNAEDEDVIAFLKLVKDKSKGPFFIHCEHGLDRTGFMCAIYRVVMQGWSKEKALDERRSFGPHRIWKNLERYIRKMDVKAIREKAGL